MNRIIQGALAAVDLTYSGRVSIRHPLDTIVNKIGLDTVKSAVRRPLAGLKVVSYYGCLLVRPPSIMRFDSAEHPVVMNHILRALGADVQEWSYAADCCGGSGALPRTDIGRRLVSKLATAAREAGADALVTACPLCQMNLEMRQTARPALPAFYFTELMGLALGLPETSTWWGKHLIAPVPVLAAAGLA
jgi:heterodisulfide reductase subunit B